MSLIQIYNEKYGKDWDLVVGLSKLSSPSPGLHTAKAIALGTLYQMSVTSYADHMRSVGSKVLVASGVKQILDSIKAGHWDARKPNIPDFEEAADEIDQRRLRVTLQRAAKLHVNVESAARAFVAQLEDPKFLGELNNQGGTDPRVKPYYTPIDQLFLLNLFAMHLPDSQAGIDYLKRSSIAPWGPLAANMSLYNTDRFLEAFVLPPDIGALSTTYLDPATNKPTSTTVARLKAGGDLVLGSYVTYRAYVVAGLMQQIENVDVTETLLLRNLMECWERVIPDQMLRGGAPKTLREGFDRILEDQGEVMQRIRKVSPYAAASALAIVSVVGLHLAVKEFRKDPNAVKFLDATKEVTNIVAALSDALAHATAGAAGRAHLVFARVATVFSIVTGAIDVLVNVQETFDNAFGDPDQVLASSLKLAGAGLALSSAIYTMAVGAVVAGPFGVALVVAGLLASLAGTLLTRQDTYIETFLKYTAMGNRAGQTSSDPDDVEFGFTAAGYSRQISAYLNMIYGCTLEVYQGKEVDEDGAITRRLHFDLNSAIPIPVGAKVYFFTIGSARDFPATDTFQIQGLGGRSTRGLVEILQSAPEFFEHWARSSESEDFVLNRIVYQPSVSDAGVFDLYYEAQISMADEGATSIQRAIISNGTGIPIRFIPYYSSLQLMARARVKPPVS
jgi:hypothetical protein